MGFIGHENNQIRLLAVENLVPYSTAQPSIFKVNNLEPIHDLQILVADHPVSLYFLSAFGMNVNFIKL